MSALDLVAAIAIVAYVISRQLVGEKLRGKRILLLPAVLVVIGAGDLIGHGHHPGGADDALIALEAVVATGVGVAQGRVMRLERRDGVLWGQMPPRSLWLRLGFIVSRVVLDLVSSGLGAHVAASTAAVLLTLGLNRLAQGAVMAPRALASGITPAPERDGSTFLAGVFGERRSTGGPTTAHRAPPGGALTDGPSRRPAAEIPCDEGGPVGPTEAVAGDATARRAGWLADLAMIADQVTRNRRDLYRVPAPGPGSLSGTAGDPGRSRGRDRRSGRRRR